MLHVWFAPQLKGKRVLTYHSFSSSISMRLSPFHHDCWGVCSQSFWREPLSLIWDHKRALLGPRGSKINGDEVPGYQSVEFLFESLVFLPTECTCGQSTPLATSRSPCPCLGTDIFTEPPSQDAKFPACLGAHLHHCCSC